MESVAPNPVELVETVETSILLIRGQKVLIDADLAQLYGVPTKRFNEQVRRNRERFPADFMFQLTVEEKSEVVANCVHLAKLKYSPYQPFAFTEHGAIMAATILNSPKATEMSVFIVRAFVRLRGMLSAHHELADKLDELENKVATHDQAITGLLNAIRQLTSPPAQPKRPIGFTADIEKSRQ